MTALPPRPQIAVSAAIFHDRKILMVRRTRKPANHFYTLPGGRVEYGETLKQALAREVAEETGLQIEIGDMLGWRELLPAQSGGVGHFVILPFAARWVGGEIRLNDELDDAKWLPPDGLSHLTLTDRLQEIIDEAARLMNA